jgi:hypothetical protein
MLMTRIIITDKNNLNFQTNLNQTIKDINTCFKANLLTLNFKKLNIWSFGP